MRWPQHIAAMDGKEKWRNWALIGRERHTHPAQEGFLPYPTRALRTPDHLYVINFKPERWPMGQPNQITDDYQADFEALANDTYLGFADIDAGPTKAWLVEHRKQADLARETL